MYTVSFHVYEVLIDTHQCSHRKQSGGCLEVGEGWEGRIKKKQGDGEKSVHYFGSGDSCKGVYICPNIKLYTLNMSSSFHANYTSI